ncbi:MAG: asparaginase domain-containing protein [Campylobacterota bacterium]
MKIDIINTGGTFSKKYNPINGQFELDKGDRHILSILNNTYGNIEFSLKNIIAKDSLDIDDNDRKLLADTIEACTNHVIVIHGTDTMKESCEYVATQLPHLGVNVVFTGSMYPYSISSDEPTFNLATSIAAIKFLKTPGVYIAMHGVVDSYQNIEKDYKLGKFYKLIG